MRHPGVRVATLVAGLVALVAVGRPAAAEVFLDLYAGASFFSDPDITVKQGNVSIEKERGKADPDVTVGGRLGYWFNLQGLPWLGLAADVSYFEPEFTPKSGNPNLVKVKVRTVPMTPLVMLRVPLAASLDHPNGVVQLYAAAGPGFFWTESTTRFLNGVTEKISADTVQVGVDARAGIAFELFPNVALFAEYRFTHFSVSPSGSLNGQRTKVDADLDANHILGGISFRFH